MKLIKSHDVTFFENKYVSPESFDELLNHDIPLQIPEFIAIEQLDEPHASDSERYAVRIMPPTYRPLLSSQQQHNERQYLILLPQRQIDEEDSSSSDDESPLSIPDDSDSDTDTGIDANVNATLPTVSALIQCSLTPSIDLEEQEEEVDTGTYTPVTQTPTEPAELLLNPV